MRLSQNWFPPSNLTFSQCISHSSSQKSLSKMVHWCCLSSIKILCWHLINYSIKPTFSVKHITPSTDLLSWLIAPLLTVFFLENWWLCTDSSFFLFVHWLCSFFEHTFRHCCHWESSWPSQTGLMTTLLFPKHLLHTSHSSISHMILKCLGSLLCWRYNW